MEEQEIKENKEWLEDFIRAFGCNFDDLEKRSFDEIVVCLGELEKYRALGMTSEQVKQMQIDYCAKSVILEEYKVLGTVEELKGKNEKLQAYKNQMSIYAEQHKVILASDVLDMLEELE